MKTIGILGGFGPQATMELERQIHLAAQRLIPPDWNRGYPPMVVYYHRLPPVATSGDRTPLLPLRVAPELIEAARRLGALADFLVIPGNAPHLFQRQIEDAAGRPILSMIDAALAEIGRRGWRRVGVLGFGDPRVPVYSERLLAMGLAIEVVGAELQARLNEAIIRLQEGSATDASRGAVREGLALLRARGVDGTILGCTELPLLLGAAAETSDLLDPIPLLAKAAVEHAIA